LASLSISTSVWFAIRLFTHSEQHPQAFPTICVSNGVWNKPYNKPLKINNLML